MAFQAAIFDLRTPFLSLIAFSFLLGATLQAEPEAMPGSMQFQSFAPQHLSVELVSTKKFLSLLGRENVMVAGEIRQVSKVDGAIIYPDEKFCFITTDLYNWETKLSSIESISLKLIDIRETDVGSRYFLNLKFEQGFTVTCGKTRVNHFTIADLRYVAQGMLTFSATQELLDAWEKKKPKTIDGFDLSSGIAGKITGVVEYYGKTLTGFSAYDPSLHYCMTTKDDVKFCVKGQVVAFFPQHDYYMTFNGLIAAYFAVPFGEMDSVYLSNRSQGKTLIKSNSIQIISDKENKRCEAGNQSYWQMELDVISYPPKWYFTDICAPKGSQKKFDFLPQKSPLDGRALGSH